MCSTVRNTILLDKAVRNAFPFKNMTSTVTVKNLFISYKSLDIKVNYVSTLSGLCLTDFPHTIAKLGPKIVCALVTSSTFIG